MTKKAFSLLWAVLGSSLTFLLCGQTSAQTPTAPFKDLTSYVQWMQKNHKAPFDRDGAVFPKGGAQTLMKAQVAARVAQAAAPAAKAVLRYAGSSCMVRSRIRVDRFRATISLIASNPPDLGMVTSSIATSGFAFWIACTASTPSCASPTTSISG